MNKTIKWIILVIAAALLSLCLGGCSDNWESPYASLGKDGYNFTVRFDVNGGLFAGTKDVTVVDVFHPDSAATLADGTKGFYLLSPEDPARAEGAFAASKNGYFLAGWYTDRQLRVDAQGQPLDEYGVLTSESGRPQGYTYSGKWDFATNAVPVESGKSYSADEPALTLYAAWVPYIVYDIYCVDPQTEAAHLHASIASIDLEIPQWSERSGKLDMKEFPDRDGFTLDGTYLDQQLSQPLTETIRGRDQYVDYETATLSVESVPVYTTWLEGEWFKIYTAEQFTKNARLDGNYILMNDLDFADAVWPPAFIRGTFSGSIIGNGYKMRGITAIQADNSRINGGLYGMIDAGATIENVTFENATFTIEAGCRLQGASFGLLAGSIMEGAALENVQVSGSLLISQNCYPQSDYTIGLLCGSGSADGITYEITCSAAEDNATGIEISVDETGSVTVTFVNP